MPAVSVYKFYIVIIAILMGFTPASAAQQGLMVGINTTHLSGDTSVNEQNQILGFQHDKWIVSRYVNSHSNTSWAVAYESLNTGLQIAPKLNLSGSLWVGAATGYGDRLLLHLGPLTFAVLPEVQLLVDISSRWQIGATAIYIWTELGGVVVQGLVLKHQFDY
jgi:hypothetical protein